MIVKRMILTACLGAVLPALLSSTALASHYELQDIEIVTPELKEQLLKQQITGTEDLLAALLSQKDRDAFAKKHKMPLQDVTVLAQKLELMQLPGIGPKAANLLILSEINGVKALAEAKAEVLLERLITANRIHSITGVQPDIEVVNDWILRAKSAIHLLQW